MICMANRIQLNWMLQTNNGSEAFLHTLYSSFCMIFHGFIFNSLMLPKVVSLLDKQWAWLHKVHLPIKSSEIIMRSLIPRPCYNHNYFLSILIKIQFLIGVNYHTMQFLFVVCISFPYLCFCTIHVPPTLDILLLKGKIARLIPYIERDSFKHR